MIKVNKSKIPSSAFIHESTIIECDYFEVGEHTYIGPNNKITCKKFVAGDYLYITEGVDIGRGGCTGPNSEVIIGDNVGIFERTVINPSDRVTIGNDVGIGTECLLWTHGAWLDITKGFPADFGPISIGDNVWFPARSIMMPNTKIGDNCVIGSASIITRDIPSGSLAMGTPCKVIKENFYPREVNIIPLVEEIIRVWNDELCPHKDIKDTSVVFDGRLVSVLYEGELTYFDVVNKRTWGDTNKVSEDFRDFLRRRGIKIYNGLPFKSIKPIYIENFS